MRALPHLLCSPVCDRTHGERFAQAELHTWSLATAPSYDPKQLLLCLGLCCFGYSARARGCRQLREPRQPTLTLRVVSTRNTPSRSLARSRRSVYSPPLLCSQNCGETLSVWARAHSLLVVQPPIRETVPQKACVQHTIAARSENTENIMQGWPRRTSTLFLTRPPSSQYRREQVHAHDVCLPV